MRIGKKVEKEKIEFWLGEKKVILTKEPKHCLSCSRYSPFIRCKQCVKDLITVGVLQAETQDRKANTLCGSFLLYKEELALLSKEEFRKKVLQLELGRERLIERRLP